ncbi:MAG: hypothetical protein C6I05_07310 [Epsilonproteobacteria bacterium]|nr:hypothetical protein [Campylobacterota bacterium]
MKRRSFEVIFLDRGEKVSLRGKGVVILSPAFYWFHREKLDISLSQARKIAPSIFEGMVPPGEYSYFVERVGDEYHFYAYEDSKILEALQDQGIRPSQVIKVYPAQMVFRDLTAPVALGGRVLMSDNGSVVALPQGIVRSGVQSIDLNSLKLPKKSLPLRAYSMGAISQEQIFTLSLLLFFAILLYGIQTFLHKRELGQLLTQEEIIRGRYHLPATSIELKSILSSLEKVEREQLRMREVVEYALRIPLTSREHLELLRIGKRLQLELLVNSKGRAEIVKSYLGRKLRLTKIELRDKKLFVECEL